MRIVPRAPIRAFNSHSPPSPPFLVVGSLHPKENLRSCMHEGLLRENTSVVGCHLMLQVNKVRYCTGTCKDYIHQNFGFYLPPPPCLHIGLIYDTKFMHAASLPSSLSLDVICKWLLRKITTCFVSEETL